MNLDEVQRKKVGGWVDDGLKLSEIQSKISAEFGISMTYMEMRFLLDDLALKPKDQPAPPPVAPSALSKQGPGAGPASGMPPGRAPQPPPAPDDEPLMDEGDDADFPESTGNVSVTVDQLTRPGAMVSGKVTFSDNQTAEWYLDQTGRLGLASKQQGYKPSQQDIMDFQVALQNELAKLGY